MLSISKAERARAEEQLQQKDEQIHQKDVQIRQNYTEFRQAREDISEKTAEFQQKDTELISVRKSLQVFIVQCVHEFRSPSTIPMHTEVAC